MPPAMITGGGVTGWRGWSPAIALQAHSPSLVPCSRAQHFVSLRNTHSLAEYCARGSLADVLRAAKASPSKLAQLTWLRRLNMALDATKGMLCEWPGRHCAGWTAIDEQLGGGQRRYRLETGLFHGSSSCARAPLVPRAACCRPAQKGDHPQGALFILFVLLLTIFCLENGWLGTRGGLRPRGAWCC